MIYNIKEAELKSWNGKEGLILHGCGGDPQEWIDGINDLLTEEKILLDNTKFEDIYVFSCENHTCILYPFDDRVHLDMGKLALWRLSSYQQFAGVWLTDYVDNRLGGFESTQKRFKPECPLIGKNSNIFNLMGIAQRTLKECGMAEEGQEMCNRVIHSSSYYEALNIIGEYVTITDGSESSEFDESEDESQVMD